MLPLDKVLRHLKKQQKSRDLGQTHHKTYNKCPNTGMKIIFSLRDFKDRTDNQSDVKTFLCSMEQRLKNLTLPSKHIINPVQNLTSHFFMMHFNLSAPEFGI
jgi:hypothetical protein